MTWVPMRRTTRWRKWPKLRAGRKQYVARRGLFLYAERMKIAIGGDSYGLALKTRVAAWLRGQGHEVVDCGVDSADDGRSLLACTDGVCRLVSGGVAERGVLVCRSGGFPLVRANKFKGLRCVMGWDVEAMRHDREASDVNVVALAGGYGGVDAEAVLAAFLGTGFEALERRVARLSQLDEVTA